MAPPGPHHGNVAAPTTSNAVSSVYAGKRSALDAKSLTSNTCIHGMRSWKHKMHHATCCTTVQRCYGYRNTCTLVIRRTALLTCGSDRWCRSSCRPTCNTHSVLVLVSRPGCVQAAFVPYHIVLAAPTPTSAGDHRALMLPMLPTGADAGHKCMHDILHKCMACAPAHTLRNADAEACPPVLLRSASLLLLTVRCVRELMLLLVAAR